MFSFASFLKKGGGGGGGGAAGSRSNSMDEENHKLLPDPSGSEALGANGQRAGKVKSIYRRPSTSLTKTKLADGKCSIAEMKRIQFAQRMLWISEPEDSSVSRHTVHQDTVTDLSRSASPNSSDLLDVPWKLPPQPADGRRPRAVSDSALPGSILKKTPEEKSKPRPCSLRDVADLDTKETSRQKKQTNFKENVDVYYYDHKATPTAASTTTDSQKLKDHGLLHALNLIYDEISGSPQLRRASMDEVYPRSGKSEQRRRSMFSQGKDPVVDGYQEHSKRDTKPGDKSGGSPAKVSIFQEKETEILPGPDENVEMLRMVIHLTDTARKLRTSVKAMSGGYCLLVSCTRDPASKPGDGPREDDLTEKVNLPLRVNPYSVKAFIHKSGKLIIEAVVAWDV